MANKSTVLAISIIGDSTKAQTAMSKAAGSVSGFSARMGAVGGAVAGVFSTLTSSAVNYVTNLTGEMAEASDSAQKFADTLSFAGIDDSEIKNLTKSTQDYADRTVFSLSDIRNTTAQLASNGVKGYDQLAQAAGNLTAVAGGGADAYKSVGMVLTQTAGAGKLTTENWNQLSDAIPGAAGKLQEAMSSAGAYTGNFRDAMAAGQISSDEFNAALTKLGMSDVAQKAASSTKTLEGASGNLEASIVKVGSAAIDRFKPAITNAMTSAADTVSKVGDAAGKVIDWFTANGDWLMPTAIAVGVLTGAFAALNAVTAAGGIVQFVKGLTLFQNATKIATAVQAAFNLVMNANPIFLIITVIAAVTAALAYFFTQTDTGRQIWANFMSWLQNAWNNISTFFSNLWENITGFFQSAGTNVQNIWNNIIGWFKALPGRILGAFSNIGKMIGDKFGQAKDWILGKFSGAGNWLKDTGSNMIKGLWNGITNVGNWLREKISGFFGGVVDNIKNFFGIHSPSRLMQEQVGRYIGLGVGEGIIDSQNSVMKTARKFSSTVATAATDIDLNQKYGSSEFLRKPRNQNQPDKPTVVNINITGTVIDAEGTAKKIKQLVADYDRKRGN